MNVLVTGSDGFIGSHIVKRMIELGHDVVGVDRHDIDLVNESIPDHFSSVDIIFHFAADMGGVGYFSNPLHQYKPTVNNFFMDLKIIEFCLKHNILLFYPSSACIYPTYAMEKGIRLNESIIDNLAQPDQMYGWEKLTITKLIEKTQNDNLRVGILHTIFGEGQECEGERAKFPAQMTKKVIDSVKTGYIEVWGDGTQERTFQYISDAVEKIIEVALSDQYFGPVNISSDEVVTVNQCVEWLCEIAKVSPEIIYDLTKPVGVKIRRVSNEKYKKHYSYKDKVSTKEGFSLLFNYIKSNHV